MQLARGKHKEKPTKSVVKSVKFKRHGGPRKTDTEAEKLRDASVCKKKGKKLLLPGMVEAFNRGLLRYWLQRYSLFSRFDDGVKIDEQGLYSVTPEEIAKHQAARCGSRGTVIDAFTGLGGNAIQFASRKNHVIAIDIDSKRLECARHNVEVYGVAHKIDFIIGDFFQLAPSLKADFVFLAPPWGGPDYKRAKKYDIETMLEPKDGFSLFRVALSVAPSIVLFLPRTVDMEQLEQLAWLSNPPLTYEVEKNYVSGHLKAVTVYYGDVAC